MGSWFFYNWERIISRNYEVLFGQSSSGNVVIDQMPEELMWLGMVDRLSKGDITKHKEVYNTNYIECLNLMSYWYHRDKQVEQINRIRERK
jgi:hypothetical protein